MGASGIFPSSNAPNRTSVHAPRHSTGAVKNITIGEINRRHIADLMADGHEIADIIKLTRLSHVTVSRHVDHIIHLLGPQAQ